ncbi:hypothetical protein M0805_004293 [Coniferiporia weirii]|nr:hypothetical protein M0805_004293 [Coniferiporia weirii]
MAFLSTALTDQKKHQGSFLLLQSSAAQSILPVLRGIINAQLNHELVLVCALYAPTDLLGREDLLSCRVLDWTSEVQGFQDNSIDWEKRAAAVENVIREFTKPVTVVFDSVDTLDEDLQSPSETYKFLSRALASVYSRKDSSRLICHLTSLSALLPLLKQPNFSPALTHLTAHPPALLMHIATAYLTPPPSRSSDAFAPEHLKFWSVFAPLAERAREVEQLVFGTGGEGGAGGGPSDELVVEVVVRARGGDAPFSNALPNSARRRGVERVLEGWCAAKGGPVELEELESLKGVWRKQVMTEQDAPDPAKNLTFNLSLTESQQASRSQVPLPYEHNGRTLKSGHDAQIFYDPDSADDLDDEDPDEDLDI